MSDTNLDTLQILLIIIIPSFIAGFPAIISAIAAWKTRRKKDAEALNEEGSAAEKVSNAYEKLVEDLQTRIDKLTTRLEKAEIDIDTKEKEWLVNQREKDITIVKLLNKVRFLERGIDQLVNQIKDFGAVPVFVLPEENSKNTK